MSKIDGNDYTVRGITPWDAPWLFKITGDPEATRYLGFKTHETVHDAYRMIQTFETSPSTELAIVRRDCIGELLGVIMYEVSGHSITVAIHTNIHDRRAWGASRLVFMPFVRAVLRQGPIWRAWSYIHVNNVASIRGTEKAGGKFEGIMRRFGVFPNISDEPQDCRLYSVTKDDIK